MPIAVTDRRMFERFITPKMAITALTRAMREDDDLAWGWLCNLAVPMMDENVDGVAANLRAASILKSIFDIDITRHPLWPDHIKQHQDRRRMKTDLASIFPSEKFPPTHFSHIRQVGGAVKATYPHDPSNFPYHFGKSISSSTPGNPGYDSTKDPASADFRLELEPETEQSDREPAESPADTGPDQSAAFWQKSKPVEFSKTKPDTKTPAPVAESPGPSPTADGCDTSNPNE